MEKYQFPSCNVPSHYIRHRNSQGELTRKEGPQEDFLFTNIPAGQQRRSPFAR